MARSWQARHPGRAPRPIGDPSAPQCAAAAGTGASGGADSAAADAADAGEEGGCRARWGLDGRALPLPRALPPPGGPDPIQSA